VKEGLGTSAELVRLPVWAKAFHDLPEQRDIARDHELPAHSSEIWVLKQELVPGGRQ
jgi:hypothetical protein